MQRQTKMVLIIYNLLMTLLVSVAGNVCYFQHSFSCAEQDTELPDKKTGRSCVCLSANCIPQTNPCPTTDNIVFKDPSFTFIAKNSFSNYSRLNSIYIQSGSLDYIVDMAFEGQQSLKMLRIEGNKIQVEIGAFRSLENLEILQFQPKNVALTRELFTGLGSTLENLDLGTGMIRNLDNNTFDQFINLKTLSLAYNHLGTIQQRWFSRLTQLEELNLGGNKINKIGSKTFTSLTNLMYLFLENNQLDTFSFIDFSDNHKLQRLSLQNNTLTSISFSTILHSPQLLNLKILWLENNRLPTFPSLIFDYAPQLAMGRNSLQLTQNPLSCDCNIKDLIESTRHIVLDDQIRSDCTQPTCSAPTATFLHENVTVPVGEVVSLICKVAGQPNPLVSWTFNKDVAIEGTYNPVTGISQITFDKVSKSSFGKYTCTVTNNLGSSNITMNLIEKKVKYQEAGGKNDKDVKRPNGANSHMPSYVIFGNLVLLTAIVKNY